MQQWGRGKLLMSPIHSMLTSSTHWSPVNQVSMVQGTILKLLIWLVVFKRLLTMGASYDDRIMMNVASSYSALYNTVSHVGRPWFDITREQIKHLASLPFSWTQITRMLGVSRNTLYHGLVEIGLLIGYPSEKNNRYELHAILLYLLQEMPA